MKIKFEKYNPNWQSDFEKLKDELSELIGFINPKIEHIGSTSVDGLSAKPIIDILIGMNDESDLERTIIPLIDNDYAYYEEYNKNMPYRRFFVKHKTLSIPNADEYNNRLAHIHILPYNSEHWIRHIAFRDYLRTHQTVKNQYQKTKEQLSNKEWRDGNEYNEAKDTFLKEEERKAVNWYNTKVYDK